MKNTENEKAHKRAVYAALRASETPEQAVVRRAQAAAAMRKKRAARPDLERATKQRFYTSEKGKACKRREEVAYRATGGRAASEARRAAKGVTPARRASRDTHAARIKPTTEFDRWVLVEARKLAKLRTRLFGKPWQVDHITPVSRGGTSAATNLQVAPRVWNQTKGNRHAERFLGASQGA